MSPRASGWLEERERRQVVADRLVHEPLAREVEQDACSL